MKYAYSFEDISSSEESDLLTLNALEKEANRTGDFDAVHDKAQELIKENVEAQVEDTPDDESSDDSSGDTPSDAEGGSGDDAGSPFDNPEGEDPPSDDEDQPSDQKKPAASDSDKPKDDKSEEADGKKTEDVDPKDGESDLKDSDGKKQTVATESLRSEFYSRVAVESFDNINLGMNLGNLANTAWDITATGARLLKDLAVTLFELGVKFYPGVASALKTSVVYLFTKSASGLLKMIRALVDGMKRSHYSFTKRKKDVGKLREQIVNLKQKQFSARDATIELSLPSSSDEKLISWVTCAGKPSVSDTLDIVTKFMDTTISEIDKKLSFDLNAVKKLIDMSENNFTGSPADVMQVSPFGNFLHRRIKGHEQDPAYVTPYVYNVSLPDGVIFAANLPNHGLTELADISAAYKASGMFLTADSVYFAKADKVDYMDLPTLEKFLDSVEALCALGLEHVSFYQRVGKQCEALKFNYRHFYQRLTGGTKEKQVRDTLVEYVCLKQTFVKKVYLPAAIDIHEYVGAYLVRALRYAKENVAALKVVEKDSSV